MTDISAALLATVFVVFSLISLLLADPGLRAASLTVNTQGQMSALELRFAAKR
jgi:hypothetical protein